MKIHLIHPDFKHHILPLKQLVKEMSEDLYVRGEIDTPLNCAKLNLSYIPDKFKTKPKKGTKILYIHNETRDLGTLIDLVKTKTLKFQTKLVQKVVKEFEEDGIIPCAEIETCDRCRFVANDEWLEGAWKAFVGCSRCNKGFCFGHSFNINTTDRQRFSICNILIKSFTYIVDEYDGESEYDEYAE